MKLIPKPFLDEDFLLDTPTASRLYHEYAERLPIIDYHCHLNPEYVASDHRFPNLANIWLEGDHYKWRAMRWNGIDERYITGKDTSDYEKFEKWAATVPMTLGNPLYHWTHLELKTAFGISDLLSPRTARDIYDRCTEQLQQPDRSARGLMRHYRVEIVCTTDDPADSLTHHLATAKQSLPFRMLPTWRPDKALAVENPADYRRYLDRLGQAADVEINSYAALLEALRRRHHFFAKAGCRLSDHGLSKFPGEPAPADEAAKLFHRVVNQGGRLTEEEADSLRSALLEELAVMDHEAGWVQQFHIGPLRNTNTRAFRALGPDTGYDSIGDYRSAERMNRFFDRLALRDRLAKTILYNINPADNAVIATTCGNFQDPRYGAGKIQFGSGWWFLDQKDGIEHQLTSLSTLGLLSRFVGMLTDSRSFLSYPRHEYFRRILCNQLGRDIERGLLPASEIEFIGEKIVKGVCHDNAAAYFNF